MLSIIMVPANSFNVSSVKAERGFEVITIDFDPDKYTREKANLFVKYLKQLQVKAVADEWTHTLIIKAINKPCRPGTIQRIKQEADLFYIDSTLVSSGMTTSG